MYKHLYNDWTKEGYIVPLQHPHFQDEYGNEVDVMDETCIGYKVHFEWQFPETTVEHNNMF